MNPEYTLQSWLSTATRGFFPETQERIRAEYTAAFEDARAAGETDIVLGWGDPRRVNKELRRTYLTVQETELFQAVDVPMLRRRKSKKATSKRLNSGDFIAMGVLICIFAWVSYAAFGASIYAVLLFAALLSQLPMLVLTVPHIGANAALNHYSVMFFRNAWRGLLAFSATSLLLWVLPWPTREPFMRWGLPAMSVVFFLAALDARQKWLKAKNTFRQVES